MRYPFLVPNPPWLSERVDALRRIEQSGRFTNFGPVNEEFEKEVVERLFDGIGAAATVCNATLGLMLAVRLQVDRYGAKPARRLAILPSFTFAATAHAVLWCGLEPVFCDIDAETWLPDHADIARILETRGDEVAVIVPYATFGNNPDLAWYSEISNRFSVPVVVDAAASLGSCQSGQLQFGSGFEHPVVYSMHATKTFATSEAGLVYSGDPEVARAIHQLSNFGFDADRLVTTAGLNAKLSEYGALLCLEKLRHLEEAVRRRELLHERYREHLPGLSFQRSRGARQAFQFMPASLPDVAAPYRDGLIRALAEQGVEARAYFAPPLHEHPAFTRFAGGAQLDSTTRLSAASLSLPLHDSLDPSDVDQIAGIVTSCLTKVRG